MVSRNTVIVTVVVAVLVITMTIANSDTLPTTGELRGATASSGPTGFGGGDEPIDFGRKKGGGGGCTDMDMDGYCTNSVPQDCNDNNPSVHPGANEVCGDGIDQDCDYQIDEDCGPVCGDDVCEGSEAWQCGLDCPHFCGDTDGGNNPFTGGWTDGLNDTGYYNQTDTCVGPTLNEWYCVGDQIGLNQVYCGSMGANCVTGALGDQCECPEGTAFNGSDCAPEGPVCGDGICNMDDNNSAYNETLTCPQDCYSCEDSDGGSNIWQQGEIDVTWPGGSATYGDSCGSSFSNGQWTYWLREWSCENYQGEYEEVVCGDFNAECVEGACIPLNGTGNQTGNNS